MEERKREKEKEREREEEEREGGRRREKEKRTLTREKFDRECIRKKMAQSVSFEQERKKERNKYIQRVINK